MSKLLAVLDIIAMERMSDAAFRVLGNVPEWLTRLCPDLVSGQDDFKPGDTFPFLDNFLVDAEAFWEHSTSIRLPSGSWCETAPDGRAYHLEAIAAHQNERRLLFLHLLDHAYAEQQVVLQKARETTLDYHRLMRTEAALRQSEAKLAEMLGQIEKSHENLLTILHQLHPGTAILNAQGDVTFLSRSCQHLLGKSPQDVVGKPWEHVSPFPAEVKATLNAMAQRPPQQRVKLPVHFETSTGQHYWMELDIQDDPRDTCGKIIVFYDMTEVHDLRRLLHDKAQFRDLIGKSEPMMRVYDLIRAVAGVDTTVLIEGETGTGKELVARAIHFASHRQQQPFIAVNCAGLTESLVASQLFGHKRGAFTGAIADHQGLFAAAHGGTLFLDEIGDIPLHIQTSLLRVLQEREITRLGESKPRKIDVRILVATHRDLQDEVTRGTFRADLLYRIRVARIHLPPLRERRQDIPLLTSACLSQCRAALGKSVHDISHDAMRRLMLYPWPGNVRELRSAIEFALIRCRGAVIHADDLPPEVAEASPTSPLLPDTPHDARQRLLDALAQAGGNRAKAARLLGISRATFYRRLVSLEVPLNF